MKKHIFIFFLPFYCIAQIGIGTENPEHIFHVDGKSINTNTEDDKNNHFVITSEGRVGSGTNHPEGILDIRSTTSGLVLPRLTTLERDALTTEYRPTAATIYNTDISKIQINTGTSSIPIWSSLTKRISNTINTSIVFSKSDIQTTTSEIQTQIPITFQNILFNNIPPGYVTKLNDDKTVNLMEGKRYKIDVNMGKSTSTRGHFWCFIRNTTDNYNLAAVSILPSSSRLNWNSFNTMSAYLRTTKSTNIEVNCFISNTVSINDGTTPIWSITIQD